MTGSSDATGSVAESFSPAVNVIRRPHRGVAAARNAGLRHASGNLVAFCDADDVWVAGGLKQRMATLAAAPSWRSSSVT